MGILGNWLPEDPNQRAAAKQGLLAMGAAMMSSRGQNFLGTVGEGLLAGGEGYQSALAQQQQAAMHRAQQQRWELENQETQAKLAEPGELQKILSGGPAAPMGPPASLPRIGGAPAAASPSAAPATQQPDLVQTYLEYGNRLTQAGRPQQAKAYYDLAEKLRPKLKEQRALTVDGRRVMANVYEDGRTEQVEGFAPDAKELHFANTGGSTVALDPFTGKPVHTIANSVSPDAELSAATARRGQNMVDRRAQQEIAAGGKPPPGYRWTPEGTLAAIPGGPGDKLPESQQKQVVGVNNLSNAIREYRTELAGFSKTDALTTDGRARMGTKYNNMMLQAKEAYNLGVLNGPDLDILTSVITDPRSFKGLVTSKETLDTQASELDRIMQDVGAVSGMARQPQNGGKLPPKVLTRDELPKKTPAAPGAPAVGMIKGGYRFKGGNPADKTNWEKV